MAKEEILKMSRREIKRLYVIKKVIEREITQNEAGSLIDLSTRQVRRIKTRVQREGEEGIVHRSRGKLSNRGICKEVKDKILKLFEEKYYDFGPTLASEKLLERDKIKINDETLRLWLVEKQIPYKKRKKRPHRQWRQRKEYYGEMLQGDGSHHNWFEEDGEECTLMGYIDDATGIPFGRFYEYEGTFPALDSVKHYIKKNGIPQSIYLDKHQTYKSNKKLTIEEELEGTEALSQFGRALKELGIKVIYADSPQAKGRVERLFNTFQDRLIKEMRLRGIKTIEEGNKFLEWYLPVYGKRFGVKPAKEGDLHRPKLKDAELDRILCIKTERVLRNDFTIAYNKKLYQIEDNIRAKKVVVEEKFDGSISIRYKGALLKFKEITQKPEKIINEECKIKTKKIFKPAGDHPWRNYEVKLQFPPYSQKEKAKHNEKELLLIKS